MRKPVLVLTAAALVLSGTAACAEKAKESDGGPIAVTATDDSCEVAESKAKAGTVTFKVKNDGKKVTEFYVYAKGDRVMSEVENITPGNTRELIVELPAGKYETACKPGMVGDGIRSKFTVTGKAEKLTEDENLADAVKSYKRYVATQSEALVDKTGEFVDAVKAEDIDKAKELFPISRTYWERIEPVAEIFGDLDPRVDAREDDFPKGAKDPEFGGFHKLEYDLWITKDVSKSGKIADQLLKDVKEVVDRAEKEELTPLNLSNGAKELLDEVATSKITGEEDRYSHTDLWDFAANLAGSEAAVASLRPVIDEKDPELGKELDEKFAAAEEALGEHAKGDGWRLWDELSKAELKELADSINSLGEPVSEVAGVISGK